MASWHLNKIHKERISNKLSMAKILKQTWKIININIVKQNQTTCEKWLINKNKFFCPNLGCGMHMHTQLCVRMVRPCAHILNGFIHIL